MWLLSRGLVWACLAPVFYAALSASTKLAGGHLSVWQIGLGRFILGLLVIPPIVKILGLSLWGNQRVLLSARGLCGSIAFLLLVASLQRIPLSIALIIFYMYPLAAHRLCLCRYCFDSFAIRLFGRAQRWASVCRNCIGFVCRDTSPGSTIGQNQQHLHLVFLSLPDRNPYLPDTPNVPADPHRSPWHGRLAWRCRGGAIFNRCPALHKPGPDEHARP